MRSPSRIVIEGQLADAEFALLNEKTFLAVKAKRKQFWSFLFFILSSTLFFLASIPSILCACFPMALVQHIGSLVENGLRLLGYGSWGGYAFARFDEYESLKLGEKYSLSKDAEVASLRHEKYAAWIGIFACVAVIVSLTCPPAGAAALLAGLWGFALSNVIWSQGCQQNVDFGKTKMLANEDPSRRILLQLEREQARAYRNYAIAVTVLSLVVAITATVVVLFPPSVAVIGLALVAGIGLKTVVTTSLATGAMGLLGYSFYKKKKMNDEAKKLIGHNSAQIDSEEAKPKYLAAK